jgi:RpiR family transcriptional regulator, carbohydrate utilization regulator
MQTSVMARLRSTKPDLTPVLQRIADNVISDPAVVVHQTITEVADASGSSEASVLRLCRDLGFSSFQRFKLALGIELSGNRAAQPPSPTGDVIEDCLAAGISSLQQTRELLDRPTLEKVAKKLVQAKSIDVIGLGGSANAANYINFRFISLGLTSRVFSDPHLAVMSAVGLDSSRVAIGISESGSSKDTVNALRAAKAAGAFTVALTCHVRSPIAGIADAVLASASHETPLTRGAMPAIVGQVMLADILETLIIKSGAKFASRVRHIVESTLDMSY